MRRYEAKSLEAVVQQLATNYFKNGYIFYVQGFIPHGKESAVDKKLTSFYETNISKDARYYRKSVGRSTLQYLRFGRVFWLLARKGEHEFFLREKGIKDARYSPVIIEKYSISVTKDGKVTAKLSEKAYKSLKERLFFMATRKEKHEVERYIFNFPVEAYSGVKWQLTGLLKQVNRLRKTAHKERISTNCIRKFRKPVKVYESESC